MGCFCFISYKSWNMNLLQDGYVVDVPYPTFVHRQAMPGWLSNLVQLQGNQAPDLTKPYRYLELGCAMGIHLHLTAASNPLGIFLGVDFNAQQLMVAEEGLKTTKIDNLEFIHASFYELLQQDLEPFDFIVTHGVWSWISAENQKIMLELINKFLKPGGIVYCSYMSHPGATELSSIQKLMFEVSRNLQGDSATKAVQSLSLVRNIAKSHMGLFEKIPHLTQTLTELAQDKPNYIAHDFLSEHWEPQHSADMIRAFGNFDMSFITGAGIAEYLDQLNLPLDIRKIIKSLPLITMQETVRDIALYTLQRQDVYVKSRQRLSPVQQQQYLERAMFGNLPQAPVGKSLKNNTKIGKIHDAVPIFEQILSLLAQQHLTLSQLLAQLSPQISEMQLKDIILVLMWAGYIHPINPTPNAPYITATNQWMQQQQLPWQSLATFGTAIDIQS